MCNCPESTPDHAEMTEQDFVDLFELLTSRKTACGGYPERVHPQADDLMVQALIAVGWNRVADAFYRCQEEIGFWYA